MQSPTKSQILSNECNFKMRPSQTCQLAWFMNTFLCAVMTNKHKSKRFVQEGNKDNLAWGGGSFGSLSLISFRVAAAQVGSSSSSFPLSRVWELSGAAPVDAFTTGAFGGDLGSSPAKRPWCLGVIHFSHPHSPTQAAQGANYVFLLSVCFRHQSHSEWNRII